MSIKTLKVQAKSLRLAMATMGFKLTQAQALEATAKQYGFENWDTAVGVLKKAAAAQKRVPVLADMDFYPDAVWVERGFRSVCCEVGYFDREALDLLHNRKELEEYLLERASAGTGEYAEGMDTVVISLQGDGDDFSFTLNDLVGLQYRELGGMGNWLLPDGETYLRIGGQPWTPSQNVPTTRLQLPELVKSAKGCNLVVLPSGDGAEYNDYVIVPPHLSAQDVADKLGEEIGRLKDLDRENEDNDEYEEFTDADLRKFVESLGCLWVTEGVTISENWD